jgi:hypothetical protein
MVSLRWLRNLASPVLVLALAVPATAQPDGPSNRDRGSDLPPSAAGATAPSSPGSAPAGATEPTVTPPAAKNLETIEPGATMGLLGKKVRDGAGEDMGLIVDVLVDRDGAPRAAVIDFGGFLGVGSRKIAVGWRLLQLRPADPYAPVLLSLGRADVQAAPEYKPSSNPAQPVTIVGSPPTAEAPAARSDAK